MASAYLAASVRNYLQANRRKHLGQLFELLRIPSIANVSGDDDACGQCAEWLARHMEGIGLEARLVATSGKPVVLAKSEILPDRPTLLLYGHYDVQPGDPIEQWTSAPFEPTERDGAIYARGADDNKGQTFAHLMAVEAWQNAGGGLPVNLKIIIEGEEEIGSPNMEAFLTEHAAELSADTAVISDSEFFAPSVPSITYSLRGLVYVELTVCGAADDLHSGTHGGAVANPLNALAKMIAAMHDDTGRVTIPGFYDDVTDLSKAEREAWRRLPFDEASYAASLGLETLGGGERGFTVLERRWARPTLDCHGIVGGYIEPGAKTVIPAEATAKISSRLVPNQEPEKIIAGFKRFVAQNTPSGVRASIVVHSTARPVALATGSPAMQAAGEALEAAFGRKPVEIRAGASIPVVETIQRLLGLDTVLMGFGLPDDNLHAPNEKFDLEQLWGGSTASAIFMALLADRLARPPESSEK
ncbi:MAG: dipeptidase [Planctomycetes bacterium]|nr:dipeptidase [Planctomycetota bacterium]